MTPQQRYQQDLQRSDFFSDQAQVRAVVLLQDLYDRLVARENAEVSIWSRFRRLWCGSTEPEQGLYFWGGVGQGKTYLVDVFFDSLPMDNKLRVHFHHFMQRIHYELVEFAGEKNPLWLVADRIAKEARVICIDEFFVSDIADAMLLGELMKALFFRGVTLVATSNIAPKKLYEDGLQRTRFFAGY